MTHVEPVLVVDDDAVSRRVLAQALENAGFRTAVVASGAEALAWLETATPCAILLDLVMPAPDGYAVLREIRRDPARLDVPIVVLTALDADEDVALAFETGADDFVRKPFRPAELVARLRSQLRMREYVEALGRKERDAKVVLELTQTLSSTLDFRNILFTVVRRIAEVARVDRVSIVLAQGKGDVGYVVAASDDRELRDLPISLGKYPEIRQVMDTGEPLVIADASSHPLFDVVRRGMPAHAFRSLAILPILFEEKPMGVLFLRGRQPVALRDHELSLARTVANATGIALRNARILQSLKDQTQQISFARFEAERRLKALQRYLDFFNSTADGIIVVDGEGQVLFSNPRAHEILGRPEPDLARGSLRALVDAADLPRLDAIFEGFSEGIFPQMVDIAMERGARGSGDRRILSVSFGSVLREESGAILVSFRDVTSDRAMEAELTKTKEFLERVIESSVDVIVSMDMAGTILLFNRAAERVTGYESREVVGRMNARDLYAPGQAARIMRLVQGHDHGGPGRLEGYRTEVVAKDGTVVPVLLSAALILENGEPVGSVGIFTDLRERMRMEARLSEAQEELRSREKQALIAELAGAAAHELNQPLTSILGYASLLLKRLPDDSPWNKPTLIIHEQAERMAEIVRKIGKITRYETKTYLGDARIIDLDRSSGDSGAASVRGADVERSIAEQSQDAAEAELAPTSGTAIAAGESAAESGGDAHSTDAGTSAGEDLGTQSERRSAASSR